MTHWKKLATTEESIQRKKRRKKCVEPSHRNHPHPWLTDHSTDMRTIEGSKSQSEKQPAYDANRKSGKTYRKEGKERKESEERDHNKKRKAWRRSTAEPRTVQEGENGRQRIQSFVAPSGDMFQKERNTVFKAAGQALVSTQGEASSLPSYGSPTKQSLLYLHRSGLSRKRGKEKKKNEKERERRKFPRLRPGASSLQMRHNSQDQPSLAAEY